MSGHSHSFVETCRPRQGIRVHVEVAAFLPAVVQRSESPPEERLSDAASPVGGEDAEEADIPQFRVVVAAQPGSDVTHEPVPVVGDPPERGIERRVGVHVMREILDWFDRFLGAVNAAAH